MKRKFAIAASCLVLTILVVAGLWWKGLFVPSQANQAVHGDIRQLPPGLGLSLSVNHSNATTITIGTPLVFQITIQNRDAARAAGSSVRREKMKKELDGMVHTGEITREEADSMLKRELVPPAAASVKIEITEKSLSFTREDAQGTAALPWRLKLVGPEVKKVVSLDEKQTAYVTVTVAPEDTAYILKGTYRVRVYFENRSDNQWQGRVSSNPVEITVVDEPKTLPLEEKKEKHLLTVEYYLSLKDFDSAIKAVQQVFSISPKSIDGLVLLGQAQEGKGDFKAALDSYEKAFDEFYQKYPDADHPPAGLMRSIHRMRGKLGIELPVIEEQVSPGNR